MCKSISRRRFMKKSAFLVTFPYIITSGMSVKAGQTNALDQIQVGCIGVGGQGNGVMGNFLHQSDAKVVAVCDVKPHGLAAARKRVNEHYGANVCTAYKDFRELLDRPDIDVVLIATPDHWHVINAIAAARSGKDIYLEKPIGLTIAESIALRDQVHRNGVVFQFGTQQRSDRKFRFACELVRNGRIGKLHTVNVWSPGSKSGGSLKVVPVPEGLDYDMWLGPAPFTPYTEHRCSNNLYEGVFKIWPFISDYCVGWVSGWGIHPMDIAHWGIGPDAKGLVEIQGKGKFPQEGVCDTATDWDIKAKFDNGVNLNFTGPPENHPRWTEKYGRVYGDGTVFEGTEGWIHVARGGIDAYPQNILKTTIGPNEIHLYESDDHVRNFLDCVKSRQKTICPIDEAFASDTICQLSAIALHLERKLKWDPVKYRFIGDDSANRSLSRPMRSPWQI